MAAGSIKEYQPSATGGTRSLTATPHRLQNPKWPLGGPKMANRVCKGVYPYIFGRSCKFLLNKIFDQSTPSMRKGRDGGEKLRDVLQEREVASFNKF